MKLLLVAEEKLTVPCRQLEGLADYAMLLKKSKK
jgi:hypothetical protein